MIYSIGSVAFFLFVLCLKFTLRFDSHSKEGIVLNFITIFSFFLVPLSMGISEIDADLKLFKEYIEAGYIQDSSGRWVLELPEK